MKVLFAVNNESISETIIKKYQKIYGELLIYKNVYYYNAIVKEIQKEKDYNMIVISEDLETIGSTDKNKADAFILDKLEKILDVFKVEEIKPIPILFISNGKRKIKDDFIPNIFNMGIYNALVGKDRTITKICELINTPRNENQAREYYELGTAANPGIEKEVVNPREINNILRHYKKIMLTPDRFSSSFDRIAAQYDDIQLKYIIDKLPKEVGPVLEKENSKYREVLNLEKTETKKPKVKEVKPEPVKAASGIVIPSATSKEKVKTQIEIEEPKKEVVEEVIEEVEETKPEEIEIPEVKEAEKTDRKDNLEVVIEGLEEDIFIETEEDEDEEFIPIVGDFETSESEETEIEIDEDVKKVETEKPVEVLEEDDDINIFGEELNIDPDDDFVPLFDEEDEDIELQDVFAEEVKVEEELEVPTPMDIPVKAKIEPEVKPTEVELETPVQQTKEIVTQSKKEFTTPDLSAVLSRDKKVVVFVGTSKNGTSFLVNSLGMMFASIGINTAILDMTKNRNSYYLSTNNDDKLRQVAAESIPKLREGIVMGVDVVRGLTVFTGLPGDTDNFADADKILPTLAKNYSLVLIDADFDTNFGYFDAAQEIYLVQSLDVLTIQPLTAFLKELLDAGVLTTEKTKVVLNKEVAVRGLTRKILVAGISTYNNPSMSTMTNLFDRNQVQVCSIPFDQNVYSKYLENIIECKYDISGYPKKFVEALKVLANMVYPLISKQRDVNIGPSGPQMPPQGMEGPFSTGMSSTLDQMRRRL